MRKTNDIFQEIDIAMLPTKGHSLIFENDFMLTDNFGLPNEPEDIRPYVSPTYPFKITITVLLYCTQGEMHVRFNLKDFYLRPNHVLVILPNTIGECVTFSPDCRLAMIAYSSNKFKTNFQPSLSIEFQKLLVHEPILSISSEEMEESLEIYHAMRRKIMQTDFKFTHEALEGYLQVMYSNGYNWMARHLQHQQQDEKKRKSRQQILFNNFLELVQKHYKETRDLTFYASKLCLTPKYLSTVVYQVSGQHAGEWIKEYVILEAKALLKSNAYTVQQISDVLNFPNASFFGKYFKAATGYTPKKYIHE